MAKFNDRTTNEMLDLDDDDKYYIKNILKPLLEQNLMEEAREKIVEEGEWYVQLFLLASLGEDQYFFNSKKY